MKPDPDKVECLRNAEAPHNQNELKSFLGLCTFMSRFIPNYSEKTAPLRLLIKKNTPFRWTSNQENAFELLKSELTSDSVVAYFDPDRPCTLWVDASNNSVGGILLQPDNNEHLRPVCYISRALSDAEKKYSITEKEALAVIWSIEKLHIYLYHRQFGVIVDHHPLQFIFKNRNRASPRIERWQMKLQGYRFSITYKQGSKNIADFISRIRRSSVANTESNCTVSHINFVTQHAVPYTMSVETVRTESDKDTEIQNIRYALENDDWSKCPVFKNISHELCDNNGIVLRNNRIFMPMSLQKNVFDIVHKSCLGVVKTKQLLRSKVYWRNMDQDIEHFLKLCQSCQMLQQPCHETPVKMTDLPKAPWESISADFTSALPTGEKLLVVIDMFSKFPIVEIMKSTTGETVSNRLDNLFSLFGYPCRIKTDNGPPWDSVELSEFFKLRNIKHERSIPLWPRSNGQAESFMKVINKSVRHSITSKGTWKNSLKATLLNYRNCVHPATNETPSKLFYGRETNYGLPTITPFISPFYESVKDHHEHYSSNAKKYADKRCDDLTPVKPGDEVFLKRGKKDNKFQSNYYNDHFTVTKATNTIVTIRNNKTNQVYDRHISFVKPIFKSYTANETFEQSTEIQSRENIQQPLTTEKQYPLRSRK